MPDLIAVDRLEVLVIVDNATDGLSTNPKNVVSEWSGLARAGRLDVVSGPNICQAHHGLSLLLTVYVGDRGSTLLFDAGPEAGVFTRNADILGIDFSNIAAVVLSHGHWDHAGGLPAAIARISAARGGEKVLCYMHPAMFGKRGVRRSNGTVQLYEPVPDPETLSAAGARIVSTRELQVVDNVFLVSGEIPRLTAYETGVPGHVKCSADEQAWEADEAIIDERFVSVHVKGRGQVVFSACSHAGIVNVLKHACSILPSVAPNAVIGGLHLSGATEKNIPQTVTDLRQYYLKLIAPGHCTGWRALAALAGQYGDALVPTAVGKRYIL